MLVLTGNSLGQQLQKDKLLFGTYDANSDGDLDVREQKLMVISFSYMFINTIAHNYDLILVRP